MAAVQPMVSASWLRERLAEGATDIVLLDSTWSSANHQGAHDDFVKEHIKGALFFDMNKCIKPRPTCARNLQEADDFRDYVRSLGISSNSHVVLYDRHFITSSTKTWWTFRVFGHKRVSVLDGGMVNWKLLGYEMESGDKQSTKVGNFEVNLNMSLVVKFDEMVQIVRDGTRQIADTRREQHFRGDEPEPSIYVQHGLESMSMPVPSSMQAGHMRGAANITYMKFLQDKTMLLLPKEDLKKLFSDNGVDLTKPLVSTCYMGHTASIVNMAAFILGHENASLYFGSWTEFGQIGPAELVEKS